MDKLGIETTDEVLIRKLESLYYFVKGHEADICTALMLMARLQAEPEFALELARAIVELVAAYLPEFAVTVQRTECSKLVGVVCSAMGAISYEVLLSLALAAVTVEAGGALGIAKLAQALAKLAKAAKRNKMLAKSLGDIVGILENATRATRKLPKYRLVSIEGWRKPRFTEDGKILPFKGTRFPPTPIDNVGKAHAGKTISTGEVTVRFDNDGFPAFDTTFELLLEERFFGTRNPYDHFRECNRRLHDAIQSDPDLAKELGLSKQQIEKLQKSERAPDGYTWHHHQDAGRMQLVIKDVHDIAAPHTGGMSIWGGGYPR